MIIMKRLDNRLSYTLCFALTALLFTGCADVEIIQECVIDEPYGFGGGLWHGIVAPISFIGSLFNESIAMYAVNNSGGWYDFGFVLGAGLLLGGGSSAAK